MIRYYYRGNYVPPYDPLPFKGGFKRRKRSFASLNTLVPFKGRGHRGNRRFPYSSFILLSASSHAICSAFFLILCFPSPKNIKTFEFTDI